MNMGEESQELSILGVRDRDIGTAVPQTKSGIAGENRSS